MTDKSPHSRHAHSKFTTVGLVLNRVAASLGLDRRLREHALIKLWPSLVGDAFAHKSYPLFLDVEGNVVIATADAATAQELSMNRRELMKKLKAVGKGLDLSIQGMRFDLKHFSSQRAADGQGMPEGYLPLPQLADATNSELEQVEISDEQRQSLNLLEKSINENSFEFSERIKNIVEKQIRLENWRRGQNFPTCKECGQPSRMLHLEKALCLTCYLKHHTDKLK
jgi:predicted nucleic acid-binding Zn ribbon protein